MQRATAARFRNDRCNIALTTAAKPNKEQELRAAKLAYCLATIVASQGLLAH